MKDSYKVIVSMVLIYLTLSHVVVYAELSGFFVTMIPSDSQINSDATFFDIAMSPGETEVLEVLLENVTSSEIQVLQSVNTAITNRNGVIDYSQADAERDSTLVHSFKEITTADEVITLPPESSTVIQIEITLPETPFNGILLGGIHYEEKIDEAMSESSSLIENRIAFVLGLQITVGDVDDIAPMLQLNDVFETQHNYRNVVAANIQNVNSVMVGNLSVEARIYREGSDEVYREEQREMMRMAPNSNFDFPISWEYEPFEDGTYLLDLTAKAGDEIWHFRETFVINNSEELNEKAILIEPEAPSLGWVQLGLVAVAVGILSVLLMRLIKRKERKMKQKGDIK